MEAPELDREVYRRYRKKKYSGGFLFTYRGEPYHEISENRYADQTDTVKEELSNAEELGYFPESREAMAWLKVPSEQELENSIIPVEGPNEGSAFTPSLSVAQASTPLKAVKKEPEELLDSGESSFSRFASVLQAALQGLVLFPDLIVQFEACCKELAEQVREEATERHRVIEDRLMRQKAQMLHSESATWALIWHLFGEEADHMDLENEFAPTSQEAACEFITRDDTAQVCARIVKWLEGLAIKALVDDTKHKGWYAGSYLQKLGVWQQTQRAVKKMAGKAVLVQHLDPDAATREQARIHEEDRKLEEGLLEDVWNLLRAGRLDEARQLCRSSGQPWRAATLGGCGNVGPAPMPDVLRSQGKDTQLQAVELESGTAHQRFLWKWACFAASEKIAENPGESRYEAALYALQCSNIRRVLPICRDWETACWVMIKSWLQVQVDMKLAQLHPPSKIDQSNINGDLSEMSEAVVVFGATTAGPETWPQPVIDQQPHSLSTLFSKLQAGESVHESVSQSCKDPQRQIQMRVMLGEIGQLLDLLRDWIVPPEDESGFVRSHGHPQMIRFGAHLVLVLRHILSDTIKEQFREKIWLVGDLILNTYAIFLFTQRREELVGVYAAQLAPYLCEELYVHMMELRQNASAFVKQKILHSALENLPFNAGDSLKGCVINIIQRVLNRSRDIKVKGDVGECRDFDERKEDFRKAIAVQWLCLIPPPSVPNAEQIQIELLARALQHSNVVLREYALSTLQRDSRMPVGAHMVLGYLVEPFKQVLDLSHYDEGDLQENTVEFQDWREYFTCDALYRNWLKIEMSNAQILSVSVEEKEAALAAASQAINATTSFIQRKAHAWLTGPEFVVDDMLCIEWIELQAIISLVSLSGKFLAPDANICTALRSAFYSFVEDSVVQQRQLMVNVYSKGIDNFLNVDMRCLPDKGDGVGPCFGVDGGLLAAMFATAVKGELDHFHGGISLEVSQLNTWFVDKDDKRIPATYIVQGLCRRCCLPEVVLRCMQMKILLVDSDFVHEEEDLLEFVASSEHEFHGLFSPHQLQEFLMFEREYTIQILELANSRPV